METGGRPMNALAAIAAMLATASHLRRRNQGSRLQRLERSAEIRPAPGMVPVGEVAAQHRRAKARADREEPAVPGAARGAEVKGDLVTAFIPSSFEEGCPRSGRGGV